MLARRPPKPEYEPLLEPGLHVLDIDQLRALCVDRFPESTTRAEIIEGFMEVLLMIESSGLRGELWINGSYVTGKLNPQDIDFTFWHPPTQASASPVQVALMRDLSQRHTFSRYRCDHYVAPEYPEGHILRRITVEQQRYWKKQWGFDRNKAAKGFVALRLE